jgi:hypothetical protein
MMIRFSAAIVVVLVASGQAQTQTQASAPAGRVKVASGAATILHEGQPHPATVGGLVFEQDRITTGHDGRLGLMLRDETRLSVGPDSTIEISRFLYEPAESQFGFVLKVVRGAVAYVSGHIAKLSPDAVRLETPTAIVGVRGTRLLIRVGR